LKYGYSPIFCGFCAFRKAAFFCLSWLARAFAAAVFPAAFAAWIPCSSAAMIFFSFSP